MAKIYLSFDKQQTLLLSRLIGLETYCEMVELGYRVPPTSIAEKEAIALIRKYCKKNISEQLKKCELFAKIATKELEEASSTHDVSMITKATLGECYVLSEQAEMVLNELIKLDKCKTIQDALKTGKNIILII